jgi:hypothetical protein
VPRGQSHGQHCPKGKRKKSEVLWGLARRCLNLLASFFVALDRTMDEPPEAVRKHGPEGPEKYKNGREDEMVVLNFGDRPQIFDHL